MHIERFYSISLPSTMKFPSANCFSRAPYVLSCTEESSLSVMPWQSFQIWPPHFISNKQNKKNRRTNNWGKIKIDKKQVNLQVLRTQSKIWITSFSSILGELPGVWIAFETYGDFKLFDSVSISIRSFDAYVQPTVRIVKSTDGLILT